MLREPGRRIILVGDGSGQLYFLYVEGIGPGGEMPNDDGRRSL